MFGSRVGSSASRKRDASRRRGLPAAYLKVAAALCALSQLCTAAAAATPVCENVLSSSIDVLPSTCYTTCVNTKTLATGCVEQSLSSSGGSSQCLQRWMFGNAGEDLRGSSTMVTDFYECQQRCFDLSECVYWNVLDMSTTAESGERRCVLKSWRMMALARSNSQGSLQDLTCLRPGFGAGNTWLSCSGTPICGYTMTTAWGAPRVCAPTDYCDAVYFDSDAWATTTTSTASTSADNSWLDLLNTSSDNTFLIISAVGGGLAVIVIVALLVRSGKKEAAQANEPRYGPAFGADYAFNG